VSAGDSAPRWWPVAKRVLSGLFLAGVAALLALLAKRVDWAAGLEALRATSLRTILLAVGAAVASHIVYACFDLLGKVYARHPLPAPQVMLVTFVCYAFNLNLGSWIGSVALRYRLYARLGLDRPDITRVFTFSVLTNWTSYCALAGALFAAGAVPVSPMWAVSGGLLRVLGGVLCGLAAAYVVLCGRSRRRSFTLRGHVVELPPARMALTQLVLGATNWSLMALVIYLLLRQQVAYPTVLAVLMVSAVASLIAHVPGGLGVLEAMFIGLLEPRVARADLLAALIGYRLIYFLLPLLVAAAVFIVIEVKAKHLRSKNRQGGRPALFSRFARVFHPR
jgi:uncharacterized membrane protein YbhN (UPF0104 family)